MRKFYENHKGFYMMLTTHGPIGLGVYFDWFTGQTKKTRELHFQLFKLSVIFTWDK